METENKPKNRNGKEVNKAPAVQGDTIEPTVSHATDEGKVFDSKTKLYEHYKENGYEVTGGDHFTGNGVGPKRRQFDCAEEMARKAKWGMLKVDPDSRASVLEAQRKVKWGMAPISERERAQCEKEQRRYNNYLKNNPR